MARVLGRSLWCLAARVARVIRVDAVWLSVAPLDMRAGMDTLLAQVVQVFGEARPHHAYLFASRRGTRLEVLVHDGQGIWLACRRLNQGRLSRIPLSPNERSERLIEEIEKIIPQF